MAYRISFVCSDEAMVDAFEVIVTDSTTCSELCCDEIDSEDNNEDSDLVPSWVSRSGKVKALTEMKSGNLRAIKRNLERYGASTTVCEGIYQAICDELSDRGE